MLLSKLSICSLKSSNCSPINITFIIAIYFSFIMVAIDFSVYCHS